MLYTRDIYVSVLPLPSENLPSFYKTLYDPLSHTQCEREGNGSRYKLTGPGASEVGLGPNYVAYVFVFLRSITTC